MPAPSSSPTPIAVGDPGSVVGAVPDVPTAPQEILESFDRLPDPASPVADDTL